jgi:uncharacterized membrane protein YkoI
MTAFQFLKQQNKQNRTMKRSILYSLIAVATAAALTGCINVYEGHKGHCKKHEEGEKCEMSKKCEKGEAENKEAKEAQQAKLMAEAKVSKADAEKTALAKVPGGTIKESELEKENGKLIWSFDLTTPDTKDITEVAVDAITGDVVSVEKESAESEKKEAAEEKK